MKKYNTKQEAHSQKKVRGAVLKTFGWFVFALTMIFVIPTLVHAVTNPADIATGIKIIGAGGLVFAMADIGNLTQPSDRDTAPNQIGWKLWLAATNQIDPDSAFPSPNAARQLGNIPLLSGQYWHHFEGVSNSLKYNASGEKGDVTSTYQKTFTIIVKYTDAALNFLESFHGKGFCLVFKECEVDTLYELGSYCKPIDLEKFEIKYDGEGKYIMLTFGNKHWSQPYTYTGSITEVGAVTLSGGATDLAYQTGRDLYQLSDGAAAIATLSGVGSSDYGKYLTVKAPAVVTTAPTIADNTVFILKDATTWTANAGSEITFQILDDETLVEVSRVQTA